MSNLEQSRKYALECLCLEADCMQLAGDAPDTNLQSHFLRMADVWSTLAVSEPTVIRGRTFSEFETQTI